MSNGDAGRLMLLTFAIIILCITTGLCAPCPDGCAGGCKEANCSSCIAGRWGGSCEQSCDSSNCLDNKCDRSYGHCERKCNPGFAFYIYYRTCYNKCPQTCRTCEIDHYAMDLKCFSCNGGYTGYPHCQYSCIGCIDTLCNVTEGSGQCTLGCMEGYFTNSAMNYSGRIINLEVAVVSICKKCKDNCSSCSSLEYCTSCLPGTYGQSCESNSGLLTSGSSKGADDDIAIGFAIGSSIFVLALVTVLVVAIVVTKRKRLRQESRNQTETGEHVYLNDAVHINSRNTDGNSQNIGGKSGNINGESRSEIRTTSANNDDIDRHEYEYVENPGIGITDYEALRPVSRDEHVYGVPEEPASIYTFVTGRDTTVYETLNSGSTDEHVYGVPEESAYIN